MNKSPFDYGRPSQLARPPPATSRWLSRIAGKKQERGSAPARQEGCPSHLHHRLARYGEGEAMAKAGGKETAFGFHGR